MTGTKLASDIKYYLDYSKWRDADSRTETWEESVERVMEMHRNHPKIKPALEKSRWLREQVDLVEKLYKEKVILGSQRALQFGGDPIMKHNSKMYNCLSSHADRLMFFQEAMYWLMSGCGVGYSVQLQHVAKIPSLIERTKGTKTFVIPDSIEGWADAFGVLMSSYSTEPTFPEYQGYVVHFDYSLIRPKGAFIAGGFKAPGPDGLKQSIERTETLLNKTVKETKKLRPIHVYDIVCHMADAVLSGGVRRSATICLFSLEDDEMMDAKNYTNYNVRAGINPQRARSNNSVVLVRSEITWEKFQTIFQRIKDWGEPGFYFVDDLNQATNPCVEIGMWPLTITDVSGWQGCNLVTSNGSKLTSLAKFLEACTAMAVLGTLQAAYTDFKYVAKETKEIFDREALLGCSITGWMNSPEILLNEENMKRGAELILEVNAVVADIIGINRTARATCVKPEGNSSVLLESASGCHGEEAPHFFRLMQINKETEISQFINEYMPFMIEESVWSSTRSDNVVYIPVKAKEGSIFKKDLVGLKQLEVVKKIQQNWVEAGTRIEACVKPFLRHNVSNTVQVENWEEVAEYLYENRNYFSGVSFLGIFGALDYKQAPFTPVKMPQELLDTYGTAALFGAGLIVDGLHYFNHDLWDACMAVTDKSFELSGNRESVLLKREWIRRAKQFARRYFKGDLQKMVYCLKDLHLYHKWVEVNRELKSIDLGKVQFKPNYTDADTLGSASCIGGQCEVPYLVTK